ncbi:MAG: hypothetical protein JWL83_308 [Actinomycetia bacterium]|jgi:hypothetical protein|nr:hypothetical protein [Actinomycetes bacterium]
MDARRMRAVLGCVVAAAAVASALGSGAAVAAGSGGTVPTVAAFTWTQAKSVRSAADLAGVSGGARALVTTPTIEVAQIRRYVSGTMRGYGAGAGKAGHGCSDVTLTTTRMNAFGAVLTSAKTTVRNWCNNGVSVTSEPTVQRSMTAQLGWSACGWDNDYAGWLHGHDRYGAGGNALFALGNSCAGAAPQLHNDVQVQGDGQYHWSY